MAIAPTNTYSGLTGLAEDFQDTIFDISPDETPLISMAKKLKANATLHQWQTDTLAAAASNRQQEGFDATYLTAAPTTVNSNYCQISSKFVKISATADAVRKYGRKSEMAYQLVKRGKELRLDMEFAAIRNQASSAGGTGAARSSAGLESWIGGNRILAKLGGATNTTGTTPGFASGTVVAPTDGTQATFIESDLQSALQAAWTDGGDPTVILMSSTNKQRFSAFAGIATKYNEVKGKSQAMVIAAADVYVSDYGNHMVKLSRQCRDQAVLCIDPDYVGIATLRPMQKQELAKIGDSTNFQIVCEWTLVVQNSNAHAKVQDVGL